MPLAALVSGTEAFLMCCRLYKHTYWAPLSTTEATTICIVPNCCCCQAVFTDAIHSPGGENKTKLRSTVLRKIGG